MEFPIVYACFLDAVASLVFTPVCLVVSFVIPEIVVLRALRVTSTREGSLDEMDRPVSLGRVGKVIVITKVKAGTSSALTPSLWRVVWKIQILTQPKRC